MKRTSRIAVSVCAVGALIAGSAVAQDLRIGLASEPTSMDPHFHNLGPNNAIRRAIFQSLISTDENQKLVPELATSWRAVDPNTWEFKLRPGVKFTSGEAFTARDVIYSFCRVPKVEGSPSSFTTFVRPIESIETPDPLTLILKTAGPVPLMPTNLSTVAILNATASGATPNVVYKKGDCDGMGTLPKSADFGVPANAVGTGPLKLVEYTRGAQIVLERSETYWGDKTHWKKITYRPLTSAGPRVAALLAGDVDFVENPPIQDLDRIKSSGAQVVQALSNRIIYIHLDQHSDPAWKTPGVKGAEKNPFLDKRVREAFSKAINRPAIVERVMGGVAVAAGELLPHPLFGSTKDFPVTKFDADAARKLLTEAGYPNGFELVLGTPNDRYINDEKISQAIAQMLARIGIRTSLDATTAATFFTRRNKFEFSAYLAGWGADTGEMSNSLNALVVCHDPQKGLGHTNRGRYCNKQVDDLTIKAMATIDEKERETLLQQASKIAMDDYGIIPLHFEVTPWAFKKGLAYKARVDQYTLATDITLAPVN